MSNWLRRVMSFSKECRVGIPDLVLGRKWQTGKSQFEPLVVELKRPSHNLTGDDLDQLRKYASAIASDERFTQPNVTWEFWLVSNSTNDILDDQRRQPHLPYGVVQTGKYKIVVKTWTEIVGDADYRLQFVQESLKYTTDHDKGLEGPRARYAQYLPEEDEEPQGQSA
jgi:hypothetical protein